MKRCSKILLLVLAGLVSFPEGALAVLIDGLDTTRQWKVARVEFSGNEKFPDDSLHAVILTKERPWYRFWEDRPLFDPVTFTTDLERLRRFYEAEGYYSADIGYDLEVDRERDWLTVAITVREGPAVVIAEIDVAVTQERDQNRRHCPISCQSSAARSFAKSNTSKASKPCARLF